MDCIGCPFKDKKNLKHWIIFLRLLRLHQNKDYSTWKKIDELYEFLKLNECECKEDCDK